MNYVNAAIVESPGAPFTPGLVTLEDPRHDEVRVRMVAVGLCHSDLNVQAGNLPFPLPGVLGHEGAGVVEQVGSGVSSLEVGDNVLLSFSFCSECRQCKAGHPAYCETWLTRNVIGGSRSDGSSPLSRDGVPVGGHFFGQSSFSEEAIVNVRSLVKVDAEADLGILAPLGCGVQTGVGAVWNILRPSPGENLVVLGAGAVGLSAIMAAAALPSGEIIAVDREPARLELAIELGATQTINSAESDYASALATVIDGGRIDNALDTTANPALVRQTVEALRAGGACALIGVPRPGTELSLGMHDLLLGKRILGVTLGDSTPETLLPQIVDLHKRGKFPLQKIVKQYPFAELNAAASDMHSGRTVKPVLIF